MRSGDLAAGAALPPVRTLAAELAVSPGTVAAAYRQLRERGLVETAGRGGTRVRARPALGMRQSRRLPAAPGVLNLSVGAPDPDLLPDLGRALRQIAADTSVVNYDDGGPLPALVEAAQRRLAADGVPADHVSITGGALDGIERVLSANLRPGDRVAVEDPGWANLLDLVAALGLTPVSMPVDDEGPTEDGLRAALAASVDAVVVTSRAQNPTGAALGAGRARALRRLLTPYPQLLVVEDDHAAELAPDGLHRLAGATERWAFVRSVSKPYGPDLRLAVLAGDPTTVARVDGRMGLGAGWVSTILQRLVLALWTDPAVDDLVEHAKGVYIERRTLLRDALAARGVPTHGMTGINVWVPVADETAATAGLRDAGYAVAPGALYRIAAGPGIRITVAPLRTGDIEPLADAVRRVTAAPTTGRRRSA